MSEEVRDPRLEALLQEWSEKRSASNADLDRLRGQIVQSWRVSEQIGPPEEVQALRTSLQRARAAAIICACAAVVLCAFLLRQNRTTERAIDEGIVSKAAVLSEPELMNKRVLFAAVREQFPNRLAWLAETNDQVLIGLADDELQETAAARRPAVLVRFVGMSRQRVSGSWKVLWSVDVIANNEEFVEVPLDTVAQGRIALWAHALADGNVAIDTQITCDGPLPMQASASDVQESEKPATVARTRNDETEFRVLRTVVLLPDALG